MKRPFATGFVLGLALLVLAFGGLIVYRTTVAQWWLSNQLTERGFAFAKLKVTALGIGEARIGGITAGRATELQVEEVILTYRWPELFSGRRDVATTRSPRSSSSRAIARPRPRLAPCTSATLRLTPRPPCELRRLAPALR